MNIARWLIGGIIGGAIGVAIWVAVGYYANFEVGYIAWGVGLLVGIGVRTAARQEEGLPPGVTAVVLAVVAILIAKYMVINLHVSDALAEVPKITITHDDMISVHAEAIAEKIEDSGGTVNWPPERMSDDAPAEQQFPPEIWTKAKAEWDALSDQAKADRMAAHKEEIATLVNQFTEHLRAEATAEGFKGSFSPFDLLWFGLAAVTAFKLGSGTAASEE